MVDVSALGASGLPFVLEVETGKLREFARATHGEASDVAPPTFLTTAFHWQGPESDPWEQVKMDPSRGLHAEQEFVFHGRALRAGDRLTGTSRIEEIYEKTGKRGGPMTFVVMVTEFRDDAGHLVAEARLTGVETS